MTARNNTDAVQPGTPKNRPHVYCHNVKKSRQSSTERTRAYRERQRTGELPEQPHRTGRPQITSAEAKPILEQLSQAEKPTETAQGLYPTGIPTCPWSLPIQVDIAVRLRRIFEIRRVEGLNQTDVINQALAQFCDEEEAKHQ